MIHMAAKLIISDIDDKLSLMHLPNIETNSRQQSIINILLMVKLVEEYGLDPFPLLETAQIDAKNLHDPMATISLLQEVKFVRAMLATLETPNLGFYAGQRYRLSAFGNLGMAAASCESIEDAIQLFLKYLQLSYTHFDISFFKNEDIAALRFKDVYQFDELRRFYIERDFSFLLVSIRDMFARSLGEQKFKTLHFDFDCPTSIDQYEALYECQVKFSMPFNEIQFDGKYLDRALPQANPITRQLMEEHCRTQQIEILGPTSFAEQIRELVKNSEESIPNMEDIANQFKLTSRTVRRKLSAEDVSYQKIVNEELCKKAVHYLKTTHLTVEQIGYRLGYGESSSFIHAFRRWTGKIPSEYRK